MSAKVKLVVEISREFMVSWLQDATDEDVIKMVRNILEKGGICYACRVRKATF